MGAVGLEGLERTVHLAHAWINDLNERLAWNDKARAYRLLKAVLHALRDWLELDESANLAAQLPGLLRGAYYEQWRPATTPARKRSRQAFLAHVEKEFARDPLQNPVACVSAVFQMLSEKITPGEIEDVWHALPEDIRDMWPLMKSATVDVGH